MGVGAEQTGETPGEEAAGNLVPGAGTVGFGIDLTTADGWMDQTARLVELDSRGGTTVFEPPHGENRAEFVLPDNLSLIDLWQSDTSYETFESREAYGDKMAAEAEIEASAWGFSAQFAAGYSQLAQGEASKLYGLASFRTRMWQLALNDVGGLSLNPVFQSELEQLPTTFEQSNQREFYAFFSKWGTHLISSATVGGQLDYRVAVSAKATFSEQAAAASIKCEYNSLFLDSPSAATTAEWKRMASGWLSNRQAALTAVGGTLGELANFAPPSEQVNFNTPFKKWAESVAGTPGIVGARLQRVSKVAPVARVGVLDEALDSYLNASVGASIRTRYSKENPKENLAVGSISIGEEAIVPPGERTATQPMYWLVLADRDGEVLFNEARLEDSPNAFDALVSRAAPASKGKSCWVVMVATLVSMPLSLGAMQWLRSCGIEVSAGWGRQSPKTAGSMSAIGQANSPAFDGAVIENLYPQSSLYQVELPLFAAGNWHEVPSAQSSNAAG